MDYVSLIALGIGGNLGGDPPTSAVGGDELVVPVGCVVTEVWLYVLAFLLVLVLPVILAEPRSSLLPCEI